MYKKEDIIQLSEDILLNEISDFEDKDIFITDVKISQDNRITLLIDSFEGIKISDCALLSKKVENKLDREKEDFELVVSSAGLDNPFTVLKQYQKNIGKQIKIITKTGEKYKGTLIFVDEKSVEIKPEQKKISKNKKQKIEKPEKIIIDYNNIKETKSVITF